MRVVLTGAPGTGKTTTLEAFKDWTTVPEPARELIAAHGEYDDHREFVDALLGRSIENHNSVGQTALFDRAVPDCAAYAMYFGVEPTESLQAADVYRYERVFLFEPWLEIYTTDDLRTMTFEMVESFHEAIVEAYRMSGYEPIVVPHLERDARVRFISESLSSSS